MMEEVVHDLDPGGVAKGFGPEGLFESEMWEEFCFGEGHDIKFSDGERIKRKR